MKKEYGINGSMRKSVTPTKTEYFLFNSLGNMKAYSDNGEIYGYYGYDAKGERTYKAQLKAIIDNTSIYPNAKVLNIDRLFLYPDGFTTITQDGNYTKHYYAETARIASKIGSGSNNTISGGVVQTDTLQAIMRRELSELCNDTVYLINYSFPQITHLQGDSGKYEDGLYYYTGNHQHSTKFITDINGAITQAFMFLPGGQVISEYNQYWMLDTLPRFIFQAAEQDIESGLYCMGVRYLDPVRLRFNSRDAMFEKYYWMSSYNAFANSPLKYVDPTGMEIEVEDFTTGKTYKYQNINGQYGFYDKDGKLYQGSDKFINNVSKDLGKLVSKDKGKGLVDGLINNTEKTVTIGESNKKDRSFAGTHTVGLYYGDEKAMDQDGFNTIQSYVKLAHELAHIEDSWAGTMDNSDWAPAEEVQLDDTKKYSAPRVSNADKYATRRENEIRGEHGIPLRTHYSAIKVTGSYPGAYQDNNGYYTPDPRTKIQTK